MHPPLGHFPHQPGIDGTKQQLAAFGAFAGAFNVVEDPFYLGAGEVRVNHQAGVVTDVLFQAVTLELFADVGGAAALPDDGVVNRFAGLFFPDDGGFTLVGDADTGDLIGINIGFRQHFHQRGAL